MMQLPYQSFCVIQGALLIWKIHVCMVGAVVDLSIAEFADVNQ